MDQTREPIAPPLQSLENVAGRKGLRPFRLRSTRSALAAWQWLKRAIDHFSAINGTVWSASFAYYAFFALVPLMLLVVTVATGIVARGHRGLTADQAFAQIVADIPLGPDARRMVAATLMGVMQSRGKLSLVAVVGLLWSSLGFFQSLVAAINQAWGQEPLNWWKLPLQNLKMLGILLSALLLGTVLPVVLSTIEGYHSFGLEWLSLPVAIVRALAPSIVLFYGFLMFYKLAPRRRTNVTFSEVWVPALLVTALLQVCQWLLTFYSTRITNFNAVYGAFGGVVAMLLWIYLSGVVIVFGGCLCAANRLVKTSTVGPADGQPPPGVVPCT